MDFLVWLYILNLTLLLLHEIESAYWKEWEILSLPGGITGFLIIHFPLIIVLLYGLLQLYERTLTGYIFSLITGITGIIPFLVHNMIFRIKEKFQMLISQGIIYINIITGISLIIFTIFDILDK
jgi:hypothetical protein